jgi:lipoate-protein ligase A
MREPAVWRYVADDGVEAAHGLAADEFLMSAYEEPGLGRSPTLRLYTYLSWCALVGRFQDLASEVDIEACREAGIAVNRRPTGGGAIVMGSGQLGLALVGRLGEGGFPDRPQKLFEELSRGVVEGLESLGINAGFRPRNDIEVGGRKIAGVGCTVDEAGAFLFHTSLLLSMDMELLARLLVVGESKWKERAVESFAERLTTVEAERPGTEMDELREAVRRGCEKAFSASIRPGPWSPDELLAIEGLVEERYATEEWIFQPVGRPQAHGRWEGRTAAGVLKVEVALDGEVIKELRLAGDFFGSERAVRDLEAALKWQRADRPAISRALKEAWREGAILGGSPEELAASLEEAIRSVRDEAVVRETS